MKKYLCLLLALCMMFAFAACGKDKNSDSDVETISPSDMLIQTLCSKSWEISETNPDTGDNYVTFYDFYSDGTCRFSYGWSHDNLMASGNGTYSVGNDCSLTLALVHEEHGITTTMNYSTEIDSDSIKLTQVGDAGLFYYHDEGIEFVMKEHIH